MNTLRLWLEPDAALPRFQRLRWGTEKVSIGDIVRKGIHPHDANTQSTGVADELLTRLNQNACMVPDMPARYGYDVSVSRNVYIHERQDPLSRTLSAIRDEVVFVDHLTLLELIGMARDRLRDRWNHALAKKLLLSVETGFNEVRAFLKKKNKRLKLSGFASLDEYNLGKVLSLDDFADRDDLLISEAFTTCNFRLSSALGQVTDERGRLRLVPHINDFTLVTREDRKSLTYRVQRRGEELRFCPDLGGSDELRAPSRVFARRWRKDEGDLVFHADLGLLEDMIVEHNAFVAFPGLRYRYQQVNPSAWAQLEGETVKSFMVPGFCTSKWTGEQLKLVLEHYGLPKSGVKADLIGKLAGLAEAQYEERAPELRRYFSRNRFVRIARAPLHADKLDLLPEMPYIGNLVVTMYVLKHLRGNAVLDPTHKNNTYTTRQLAEALLNRKVGLRGAFLHVL